MRIRLSYKLFLVLLLANVLLIGGMVFANNRAFTLSFDTYLTNVQLRRLAPLLDELAEEYERHDGWRWVHTEPENWQRMTRRFLAPRHERHSERARRFSPALLLRNAEGNVLLGTPAESARVRWAPIRVDGERVGDLGIPVDLRLSSEFDQVFAEQQQRQLRWIAVAALLLAALVALPFARALARPIARLQYATRRLANGDYDLRVPERGSDELAELARDFNSLANALKQNQLARQRWITDISHELRTPLAVLQAQLEALQDGVVEPGRETFASLHKEVLRLSRLIADLHELSLSDSGALTYRREPVNINALLADVCLRNDALLNQRHITLDVQLPSEPLFVLGDEDRLMQLFSNLMDNSIHYTNGTGSEPGRLRIELSSGLHKLHLRWSDSAPGVPEEVLEKLFERLFRIDESRSRKTGGSGLGLSIVSNIVEAHCGSINARTSPLGGLTLELTLPAMEYTP